MVVEVVRSKVVVEEVHSKPVAEESSKLVEVVVNSKPVEVVADSSQMPRERICHKVVVGEVHSMLVEVANSRPVVVAGSTLVEEVVGSMCSGSRARRCYMTLLHPHPHICLGFCTSQLIQHPHDMCRSSNPLPNFPNIVSVEQELVVVVEVVGMSTRSHHNCKVVEEVGSIPARSTPRRPCEP